MDTEMEYLPINNIKQEAETSASDTTNSANNNNQAPDSVENKVTRNAAWEAASNPLPSGLAYR